MKVSRSGPSCIRFVPEVFKRRIKKRRKKKRPCPTQLTAAAPAPLAINVEVAQKPPSRPTSPASTASSSTPSTPSFRVLTERRPGTGLRKRKGALDLAAVPEENSSSDEEEDFEDGSYERRHQPFEQLERQGYELYPSTLALVARRAAEKEGPSPRGERGSGGTSPPAAGKAPMLALPTETALRRLNVMRAGPVPAGRCAACPPYFKHTPHTCPEKRRQAPGEAACSSSAWAAMASAGGCEACAPLLRHVAHTCGLTYTMGKRNGRRRQKAPKKAAAAAARGRRPKGEAADAA